jgi:hypothetical protein
MAGSELATPDFSADPIHIVIEPGSQTMANFADFFNNWVTNHRSPPRVPPVYK